MPNPPTGPVRVPQACVYAMQMLDPALLCESCRTDHEANPLNCDRCATQVATACIAAFLAAPGEGKWRVRAIPMSQVVRPTWEVYRETGSRGGWRFDTEPQAVAVCAALNAVTTTPEEEEK